MGRLAMRYRFSEEGDTYIMAGEGKGCIYMTNDEDSESRRRGQAVDEAKGINPEMALEIIFSK